jgi:hypothetical protein
VWFDFSYMYDSTDNRKNQVTLCQFNKCHLMLYFSFKCCNACLRALISPLQVPFVFFCFPELCIQFGVVIVLQYNRHRGTRTPNRMLRRHLHYPLCYVPKKGYYTLIYYQNSISSRVGSTLTSSVG